MTPELEALAVKRSLVGRFLCAIGSHPCVTNSDHVGIWGECTRCHRRFGYIDRATVRRYIEAELASTPTQNHKGPHDE